MNTTRAIGVIEAGGFLIGDIISFALTDGEAMEAIAVKQEPGGMIFCTVDCLATEYPMNVKNTNEGGYAESDLRKKLNSEIINRFPTEIRDRLVVFENGDLLRIPTEREIFGTNRYGEEEQGPVTQWEPMKLRRNRIAFQGFNGAPEWYWLQNRLRDPASASHFANVDIIGHCTYNNASHTWVGVRPAFKIKNL